MPRFSEPGNGEPANDAMIKRLLLPFCLALPQLLAALTVPNVFSDHMVLQRERPIPVWGKAEAGETVTVEFASQKAQAVADASGQWSLRLEPLDASFEPQILRIQGSDTELNFTDVLVGEVWLCSGQSNMDWPVKQLKDADLEIATANHPAIRLHNVTHVTSDTPVFSSAATWEVCTPATVGAFSGAGYYFGRDLHAYLHVPVGLIEAAWGGTPAIAWTRAEVLDQHPQFQEKLTEWQGHLRDYPQALKKWESEVARLKTENPALTRWQLPRKPFGPDSPHRPASLANGMLAAVAPYALRGAIWYQGENDAGWHPEDYDQRLRLMIEDWRDWWSIDDLHFGIVQLANFLQPKSEPADDAWPRLRESQRRLAHSLSHTGLAVTIDLGEANDIHPRNKQDVGRRLARWALADIYGADVLAGGPVLQKAQFDGDTVTLTFEQVGSGLAILDAHTLGGFTLAGEDGVFHPAQASIEGTDTVIVSSPEIIRPVHLRYGWQNNPVDASLGNQERLPASPFEVRK